MTDEGVTYHRGGVVVRVERMAEIAGFGKKAVNKSSDWAPGGRITNAVGTIFRKIFVGTRARPI